MHFEKFDAEEARLQYLQTGVLLYGAALRNDWVAAQTIISQDRKITHCDHKSRGNCSSRGRWSETPSVREKFAEFDGRR